MAFYAQQRNIENPKETKSAIHREKKKVSLQLVKKLFLKIILASVKKNINLIQTIFV
jgi:hypothetical protein